MRIVWRILLIAMIAAMALTACGQTAAPAEKPAEKAQEAPKAEAPATEAPKAEAPATEAPKAEATKAEAAPAGKKVVVGLVMKSLANEFFKIMEEATVKWAATQPNIDLKPVGMNSETDIDTQFAAVETFVTQGANLIVVAAADSVGMVAPVKKAVDAGITVVNFDVKLDTAALKAAGLPEDFLFVGPDNAEGAKLAGDAMAAKLGKGGKVIIIEGNPGADNATQRKNGFMKSVEEGGLELLDSKTAHWETEEANTVVSNLLTKYPDVQGIMCANDSMVLGAVKAIEAAGLTGKVEVVGFDNIPAVQDLIKQGKVLATVDQFGPDMAKNAIEVGLRVLNGEKLSGWIKTPVKLVTAADLGGAAAPAAPVAASGEKVVVGLVMKSLANEFFKIMEEATVKWAATQPNIDLKPVGMNSETDIDTQFAAVETFVTQGANLIVVAAADSVGMVAPVKKAVDAGITVVNFDVKLDTAALKAAGLPEDFLFVGPDNAEGAKLAGDAMAAKLGKGGKVIIIEGNPGADNATQRKNGFMKSVEEGGLELLDSKTAHWETEEANTVVSNLLTKYPDVQGIMCANDSMVLGAVKAIEAAGLTGKVEVVGFDNIPAVQDLIKQGKVLATVDQFGPDMAKNAIEVGLRVLNGEKLSGWIKTPVKLVTAADLGGAAAPAAPAAASGEKVVVGLVMKSLANEFFKIMEEATVKWAATQPNIDLKPVGMNSETDIDTQFAAVETFVTQGANLIVVAAADSVGMVAPVKKAVDAGITVVNFDVKLDTAALKAAGLPEDFLFVGPDNAEGAKLAGDAMAAKLGKGGKVIIIEGNPGADNATQRKNGFMKSVEEGGLELLDSKTAHWETEEANTVVSNLLTKYPDVQGIMCANDSMVLGAVKAIEAAGLTGKVEVVGFDNIPAVQDLIKQGKVLATVDQFGPDMAKNAIEVGLRVLNGEKLSGWIKTPVKLVTAADLK